MGLFNKIKNFFTGGKNMQNDFQQQNFLMNLYDEFTVSDAFKWFEIGERYYKNDTDILQRQMYAVKNGGYTVDNTQPNNQLNHNFTKCLVDQKVDYSLSKKPKITCEDDNYLNLLETILQDNKFEYKLNILGKKVSNNGVYWVHPYVNEAGAFKFDLVPSTQVIPIWADDLEQELDGAVRCYIENQTILGSINQITVIEYWTKTGVSKYQLQGNNLVQYQTEDLLQEADGSENGHFTLNNKPQSWGIVPFIPFKNNLDMYPDVRYVKNLIDNYDLTRSDLGNALEQLRNFILVLNNAQGTDTEELLNNLKLYGIIKTENVDGSGSSVDMLSNPIDATASTTHTQLLKENIIELLQGVNLNLDFNVPPSGVSLQLLFSSLDIKCNGFETELRQGFNLLQDFINLYLLEKGSIKTKTLADIEFVRNVINNQGEAIQQAKDSQGIISNKTIFEHHPFVHDPDEEEKRFNKEQQVYNNHFDHVTGLEGANL